MTRLQRLFRNTTRSLLFAAALTVGVMVSTTASAVDCTINAFSAYSAAVKKGWNFRCVKGNYIDSIVFLPLVPDALGCVAKANWLYGGIIRAYLFYKPTWSARTGGDEKWRKMKNGWILKDYDVVGGQYQKAYDTNNTLIIFRARIAPSRSVTYKVKNLVLSKDGGSCRNALQEAF